MPRKLRVLVPSVVSILVALAWMSAGLVGQVSPAGSDWTTYSGELLAFRLPQSSESR